MWNEIASERDQVSLLPPLVRQLAAYRRHHSRRGLCHLLPSQSFLNFWANELAALLTERATEEVKATYV
jgi:hypothetical protein